MNSGASTTEKPLDLLRCKELMQALED